MTPTKFQPKRLPPALAHAWQKLPGSRRRLKVLALGKEWDFQFVLGIEKKHASLLSNGVAANIRLGDHSGAVRCALLPGGPWLSELLRGPSIATLQEPFRTAVIGVILQDFLQSLSQSSHFPLQVVAEAPPAQQSVPLYWQMLNEQNQVEILGSLAAEEGLVTEICNLATNWTSAPWSFTDSFRVSLDVLLDSLSVQKTDASLEVGDIFLLGEFAKWREGHFSVRIKSGPQDGSLLPIKVPRSTLESTIFSQWNWRSADQRNNGREDLSLVPESDETESASINMPKTQKHEDPDSHSWSAGSGGEGETRWMDSVEVMLEFSVGRHTMTLGELKRVGQGHIFPINSPANGLVNILVHGQSIGRGELVQVGEAVGILVREIGEIHHSDS